MKTYTDAYLDDIAQSFEDAAPQAVLRWAAETFGQKLAVVTSFQHTGIVTLHMLQTIAPKTPVLTLDTGNLFPETYELINDVEARFQLNLHRIRPSDDIPDDLWKEDVEACCHQRKVVPLQNALKSYDAWITGLRRDQAPTRANTPIVSRDPKNGMVKIAPFATWTADMIDVYVNAHGLPYNKLYDMGYSSIGCWPCTRPVADGEDARAGRWAGQSKTECGIHIVESS